MSQLSTRKIETLKATAAEQRLADGDGLYLRVVPNGTKSFQFRYTYATKRQTHTLGTFPELSLARAREKAHVCRTALAEGKNPGHMAILDKAEKNAALPILELINDYHERHLKLKRKRPKYDYNLLLKNCAPIETILTPDVTPQHITVAVNKVVERGSLVVANRFRTALMGMFKFAVNQRYISESPVVLTRDAAGGRETPVRKSLQFHELQIVLTLLQAPPSGNRRRVAWQTAAALVVIILTMQRPGEVVRMEWAEIDFDLCIWTIPAEFTKEPENGDHVVHLSRQAIQFLQAIKQRGASSKYVFPTSKTQLKPGQSPHVARHSLSQAMKSWQNDGIVKFKFKPHDLRRTGATRMGDLNPPVEPHVVEKILNHKMEGVMAVYNLNDYFPARKLALQRWGDRVQELLSNR